MPGGKVRGTRSCTAGAEGMDRLPPPRLGRAGTFPRRVVLAGAATVRPLGPAAFRNRLKGAASEAEAPGAGGWGPGVIIGGQGIDALP